MDKNRVKEAYRFLGIDQNSTIIEVTKAYRNLAKKYHPDYHREEQQKFHQMMIRLNEAYSVIKEYIESETRFDSRRVKPGDRGFKNYNKSYSAEYSGGYRNSKLWSWVENFERKKREAEEKQRRIYEKRKREEKAFREFFERLAREQMLEKKDKPKFDILMKNTMNILGDFFKNNFHNIRFRERPHIKMLFNEFMYKYELLLEKSKKLSVTCNSELYKIRSWYLYDFLRSFIFDAVKVIAYPTGVSASSLQMFEDAVYISERFMYSFFSAKEPFTLEEAKQMFKRTLAGYEYFIKSFPESNLLSYAKSKIELLEKFYMAFLR